MSSALVPGRECGDCTQCCTVMAIDKPDIQKEAGVTCRHCQRGSAMNQAGCAIYQTRPSLCRDYYCGWRQLAFLDDSWRPDRSGIHVEQESIDGVPGLSLVLVANPLRTLRQPWFVDFVAQKVRAQVPLLLGILGPPGHEGASLLLNTRQMHDAAGQSRAAVKALLEDELKRLSAHDFPVRVIRNTGNNVGLA